MRRLLMIAGIVGVAVAAGTTTAAAQGVSPAQFTRAGWTCFNGPASFNPLVHCARPGELETILSGEAATATFLTFDTIDVTATDARLLGTERIIRGDLFQGQPCPTDPPTFQYGYLGPLLGWDYYICHTFDSPGRGDRRTP
jgi:hypothetical protein